MKSSFELSRIVAFEWDEGNAGKNAKHGVTDEEAQEVFAPGRFFVVDDIKHSQGERRFHAYGTTSIGRKLHITFTLRQDGTLVRVISARPMRRDERTFYEEEVEADPPLQD